MMSMLTAIPALRDNYIWQLELPQQGVRVWLDPGDPALVNSLPDALLPTHVLITHCHRDHIDGLPLLRQRQPQLQVFGPSYIQHIDPLAKHAMADTELELAGLPAIKVLSVPGHTLDHLAYLVKASSGNETDVLFCGDTLFSLGCGRLFEGTPSQMWDSLQQLAQLDENTRVCPTHEYTLANAQFAIAVDPTNTELQRYQSWCEQQRQAGKPTLPTTMGEQRRLNPFLQCNDPIWLQRFQQATPTELFAYLRAWKDRF